MKYASVPFNQNKNGWLNENLVLNTYPTLNKDIDADWVVIGSGYAGVSFARKLAHHDPRSLLTLRLRQKALPQEIQGLLLDYRIISVVQQQS